MKKIFYSLGIPLGVMLSPESLVLLGNTGGANGAYFYISLFITGLTALFFVAVTHSSKLANDQLGDVGIVRGAFGESVAMSLCLVGRIPVILLAGTGILVTAGYGFNEIFLYWFPNFAFAFLLLGMIVVVNALSEKWAFIIQAATSLLTLSCLTVLMLLGVLSTEPAIPVATAEETRYSLIHGVSVLLLLLGCDLSLYSGEGRNTRLLRYLVFILFLFFACWVFFSRQYVAPRILFESTIPHIIVAKSALDQGGRLLIGSVIVSGAFATVNGLFLYAGITFERLGKIDLISRDMTGIWGKRILFFLLAAFIGVLMMTGLAGSEKLATYYRGALLLWLLLMAVVSFAAFCSLRASQPVLSKLALVPATVLSGGIVVMIFGDRNSGLLFTFMVLLLVSAGFLSTFWLKVVRRSL
jgi:hypothetical protein